MQCLCACQTNTAFERHLERSRHAQQQHMARGRNSAAKTSSSHICSAKRGVPECTPVFNYCIKITLIKQLFYVMVSGSIVAVPSFASMVIFLTWRLKCQLSLSGKPPVIVWLSHFRVHRGCSQSVWLGCSCISTCSASLPSLWKKSRSGRNYMPTHWWLTVIPVSAID